MKKILNKIIFSLIFFLILSTSVYSAQYKKTKYTQVTVRNELNCGITATIFEYTTRSGKTRRTYHGPFTIFPERESHQRIRVLKNTLWLKVYLNNIEIKKLQFTVSDASNQGIKIIVNPGRYGISLKVK